jgi:hypothetical protein
MQEALTNTQAIRKIADAEDPVSAVREIIEAEGGYWCEETASDASRVFEIHLFGLAGIGAGARDAVKNWLERALSLEETSHAA